RRIALDDIAERRCLGVRARVVRADGVAAGTARFERELAGIARCFGACGRGDGHCDAQDALCWWKSHRWPHALFAVSGLLSFRRAVPSGRVRPKTLQSGDAIFRLMIYAMMSSRSASGMMKSG